MKFRLRSIESKLLNFLSNFAFFAAGWIKMLSARITDQPITKSESTHIRGMHMVKLKFKLSIQNEENDLESYLSSIAAKLISYEVFSFQTFHSVKFIFDKMVLPGRFPPRGKILF